MPVRPDEDSPAFDVAFDYEGFEQTIDEAEQEEVPTDPGEVVPEVVERPTIDLLQFPREDATYTTRKVGAYMVVTIRGRINESFPGAELGASLGERVVFDVTEVERITSFGVRAWLQMMERARCQEAVLVRASPAMVNQITMMRSFTGRAKIHSVVAPYACASCGDQFGVTYDAVEDSTAVRSRSPFVVACPSCAAPCEMDEDPWVYFALDEHLLDAVSKELREVLQSLGDRPVHAPIEIALLEDATRLRFNGRVDGTTRFAKVFDTLEGAVLLDFQPAQVDLAGVEAIYRHISTLSGELPEISIEACPLALLERLLERPLPHVGVLSVATEAVVPGRSLRRRVVIDLERYRDTLARGQLPPLDLPEMFASARLDGMDTIRAACQVQSPVPTERPAVRREVLPASTTRKVAIGFFGVGGLALIGSGLLLLAVGVAFFLWSERSEPPPEAVAEPVEVRWSSGGMLPPAWVDRPLQEEGEQVVVAGLGAGPDLPTALEEARRSALAKLIPVVEPALEPIHPEDRFPLDGEERRRAMVRWAELLQPVAVERRDEASREEAGRHEIAVQYAVRRADVEARVEPYRRTGRYHTLRFAPRPPWMEPGLRLVLGSGEKGDRVVAIGGEEVRTLERLAELAAIFDGLPSGTRVELDLQRGDKVIRAPLIKP